MTLKRIRHREITKPMTEIEKQTNQQKKIQRIKGTKNWFSQN